MLGVKKTTMANKAKMVRDLLKLNHFDPEFTSKSVMDSDPLQWMVFINGFPVDVRQLPLEAQRHIFEQGLIPYVPGEEPSNG